MTDYEIDIREIKETLKKMQEDIKRIESNIPLYQPTYQYSPECFDKYPMYDNWQSCSVPSTQACSEEELLRQLKNNYNI